MDYTILETKEIHGDQEISLNKCGDKTYVCLVRRNEGAESDIVCGPLSSDRAALTDYLAMVGIFAAGLYDFETRAKIVRRIIGVGC